ncbi:MAG: hypothetical protein ACI8W8_004746 [Rhodothermales bacterium]|jgi:hypothetical protein
MTKETTAKGKALWPDKVLIELKDRGKPRGNPTLDDPQPLLDWLKESGAPKPGKHLSDFCAHALFKVAGQDFITRDSVTGESQRSGYSNCPREKRQKGPSAAIGHSPYRLEAGVRIFSAL